MKKATEIARSLKADPKREAVDSIRGYDWQRWLTVELWLGLKGEDRVWIELGEDITISRSSDIETVQAKDLASKITLGQKKIQEIIDRALVRDAGVNTTIWTTADLGNEKSDPFGEPGIRYWTRVTEDGADVTPLTNFLSAAKNLSADAKATLTGKSPDELLACLRKVRWISAEVDLNGLRTRILPQIESRLIELKVPGASSLRETFAEFLFSLVAKIAVQKSPDDRSLSRPDLDEVILDTFARFANASMPAVISDVTKALDGYIGGLPTNLVDREIQSGVTKLIKCRFFAGYHRDSEARALANRIMQGDLRTGSPGAKGIALSWIARFLSGENLSESIELNRQALSWYTSDETRINSCFIKAANGETASALSELALLSSKSARTASLLIYANGRSRTDMRKWMADASLTVSDLDADGKTYLLILAIQDTEWDEALAIFGAVTEADIEAGPTLAYLGAQSKLAQAIDPDLREAGIGFLPMDLAGFPLSNDAIGLQNIREARALFEKGAELATDLELAGNASLCDDFALWLELRDPTTKSDGLARLRKSFSDKKTGLRRVNFALAFGVRVDRQQIIAEANRELAISGNSSFEAIFAKFLLAIDAGLDEKLANFISDERDLLEKAIDPNSLAGIEVQALANAGLIDRAETALKALETKNPTAPNLQNLRRFIAEKSGEDPVGLRKAAYESTKSLQDLGLLVDALEASRDLPQTIKYGTTLFERVKSLAVAVKLVRAMMDNNDNAKAFIFLSAAQDLVKQSEYLQACWCEQLYLKGKLTEAESAIDALRLNLDQPFYRRLATRIAITGGNWPGLATIVEDIWRQRDTLSPQEVFFGARLAGNIGSDRQLDLIITGANSNGGSDPAALITAYTVAVQGGIETPETAVWLNNAIALSDPEGPVQRVSLREIADQAPGWRERQTVASQRSREGALPMFAIASSLNTSLGSFLLLRALANSQERDLRARLIIYAYSGQRLEVEVSASTVGLDGTALLTLELLGVTELVLGAFQQVHIPHATLGWLFEERNRIQFHQPRRMRDAEKLRNLVAEGKIERFSPTTAPSPDLVNEVGFDFAAIVCEAAASPPDQHRYVVCSPPIHKAGSMLEEEVDLSQHQATLVTSAGIVDRLQERGVITAMEGEEAQRYLATQANRWTNEPAIQGDATVYLDDVSVSHLMHLNLLEKLSAAGMRAYVTPHEAEEGIMMLKHQALVSRATDVIDSLRSKLRNAILAGSVHLGPRPAKSNKLLGEAEDEAEADDHEYDEDNDISFRVHPTVSILDVVPAVDAVVVDDRFLNMHHRMDVPGKSVPLHTTFDLLGLLLAQTKITDGQMAHLTAKLRSFGYQFVPLTEAELNAAISTSKVVNAKLLPSAELLAIRDSILHARSTSALLLPEEANWLTNLVGVLAKAIKAQWRPHIDTETAFARSTWLVQFMDMRDWAMCFRERDGAHLAGGVPLYLALLARAEDGSTEEDASRYFSWLSEAVFEPIRHANPTEYNAFLEYFDQIIRRSVDRLVEVATNDED